MDTESVSRWIDQLKEGNRHAVLLLWERYGNSLQRLARNRYGAVLNATFDEQDLAQSVFLALWKNAQEGRLEGVQDRTELWWLLLEITRRRALSRLQFNKAKKRSGDQIDVIQKSTEAGRDVDLFSQLRDPRELPPEMIVILNEEHDRFMHLLQDDTLREIAREKLEGCTVEEIAIHLNCSKRTIIRKLNLIRDFWTRELDHEPMGP